MTLFSKLNSAIHPINNSTTSALVSPMEEQSHISRRAMACMLISGVAILSVDVASAANIESLGGNLKVGANWLTSFLTTEAVNVMSGLLFLSGAWMVKSGMSMDKIAAVGGAIGLLQSTHLLTSAKVLSKAAVV